MSADTPQLLDVDKAVAYFHSIGATAATKTFVRRLMATGEIPRERISKKFYISRADVDLWVSKHLRRAQ